MTDEKKPVKFIEQWLPQYETPALAELRPLKQWICWKVALNPKGKVIKKPVTRFGINASVTDESIRATYDECFCEVASPKQTNNKVRLNGVGFVFTADDDYIGIDLDKCRDKKTGVIEDWALKVMKTIDSYTELSPSKTGVHIICRGDAMPRGKRKDHFEMYFMERYFTFTGEHISGYPDTINDRHEQALALEIEFCGERQKESELVEVEDHLFKLHSQMKISKEVLAVVLANNSDFQKAWNHKRPDLDGSLSSYDMALAYQCVKMEWGPEAVAGCIVHHRREYSGGSGPDFDKSQRIDYIKRTYLAAKSWFDRGLEGVTAEIDDAMNKGGEEALAKLATKLKIPVDHVIKRGDEPSVYYIVSKGIEMKLGGSQELFIQRRVRGIISDFTKMVIDLHTEKNWNKLIELLLSVAIFEKLAGAGSIEEMIGLAGDYASMKNIGTDDDWKDHFVNGEPFIKDKRLFIHGKHFQIWMRYEVDLRFKPRDLRYRLKEAGFISKPISTRDTGGNTINKSYWSIELTELTQEFKSREQEVKENAEELIQEIGGVENPVQEEKDREQGHKTGTQEEIDGIL